MAEVNSITVAPGVTREDFLWGYILQGSKAALIASGLVGPSFFPEEGARTKRGQVVRHKINTVEGRQIVTRVPATGPAHVHVSFSESERNAARTRGDLARALEREKLELAWVPRSQGHFQELSAILMDVALKGALRSLKKGLPGWRFCDETFAEIEALAGEMLDKVRSGRALHDPKHQARCIVAIKAETAKADPAVHRFMAQLLGTLDTRTGG